MSSINAFVKIHKYTDLVTDAWDTKPYHYFKACPVNIAFFSDSLNWAADAA